MKLEKNQIWISETHPHENFKIYDVITQEWDHHDTETFYCWERTNLEEFNTFVAAKKGMTLKEFEQSNKTTYPYVWAGEGKEAFVKRKIKLYNMQLENNKF